MQDINSEIHKSLLPINHKSILSYIIDALPKDASIGLLLGHKSKQILDFLELTYADRIFEKIHVPDWESEKSGTFRSIESAEEFLKGSFWYLPCDGIFQSDIFKLNFSADHYFAQKINLDEQANYTVFVSEENRIKKILPRGSSDIDGLAFTGIMYIQDSAKFISYLRQKNVNDFAENITIGSNIYEIDNWKDLGNPRSYRKELNEYQEIDFSKSNEITYIHKNKIIKWWNDEKIVYAKTKKPEKFPNLFPKNIKSAGQFQIYDKAIGESLYKSIDNRIFKNFLNLMSKNFWIEENYEIEGDVEDFYKNKTLIRYSMALNRLEIANKEITKVNESKVKEMSVYLKSIDWAELITNSICTPIHGDLQFDNIIYDKLNFTLIDWRPNFGNQNVYGDIYYDFAKLLGGMKLNYFKVKNGDLKINIDDSKIYIDYQHVDNFEELYSIFCDYLNDNDFDLNKVKKLIPIIYLNMAPLHSEPFASFLWALSLKEFANLD